MIYCQPECYDKHREIEESMLIHPKALKTVIHEALAEMGVIGSPVTMSIKCRNIDCIHNFSFWCQHDKGPVSIDGDGLCLSYEKF